MRNRRIQKIDNRKSVQGIIPEKYDQEEKMVKDAKVRKE
jgi:hypothetical protein